jgi:hypothetical protein
MIFTAHFALTGFVQGRQGPPRTARVHCISLSRKTMGAFPTGRGPAAGIVVFLCRAVSGKQENIFSLRLFAILSETGGENVVVFKPLM